MENTAQETKKRIEVSGSHIMNYSEEDLLQKRTSISAIIEKLNAEQVRGDVIDEFEEERQRTIGEQKTQLQNKHDEAEAAYRQELEEKRLAELAEQEAAEAEEKRRKTDAKKEGREALAKTATDLSKKLKKEFFKNGLVQKVFKPDDIPELEDEEEESLELEEDEFSLNKKEYKKKGSFFKRKEIEEEDTSVSEEESVEIEEIKETKTKKELKQKIKKEKPVKAPKKTSKQEKKGIPTGRKVSISYIEEPIIDNRPPEVLETKEVAKTPMQEHQEAVLTHNDRKYVLQEDISRFHEPVSMDEVYRFRSALERFSSDTYRSVSVYAACIIDREFKSISIIKNVTLLANLIEQSGDDLDFYYAFIITNKGVQHYGSDEALSDVSLAMEALRQLFIQKKGRASIEQIQKLPSLKIFQTIYYEDKR